MPRSRRGLTMMELMVVLALLVAMAAIVVPLLGDQSASGRETVTRANMTQLRDVILGQYRTDVKDDLQAQLNSVRDPSVKMRPLALPRSRFQAAVDTPGPPWSGSGHNRPNPAFLMVNPGFDDATAFGLTRQTYRPDTRRGWRGPYIKSTGSYQPDVVNGFTTDYANANDPCVMDGWTRPIVLIETLVGTTATEYELQAALLSAGPDGKLMTADDISLVVESRRELFLP